MTALHNRPEVYLFLLWSQARHHQSQILADLNAHFTILDTIEVTWTVGDTFAQNLTRMYGSALPPGSDKELHCGTGPFLAVVVEDQRPKYRLRRTNRGVKVLNSTVFDARQRYRDWTGGGYRVHASDSVSETERNLVLLFGQGSREFQERGPRSDSPRCHDSDPVGAHSWRSVEQLVAALRAHGGTVISRTSPDEILTMMSSDVWWDELIAGGRELGPGVRQVQVNAEPLTVVFEEQPKGMATRARSLARRWTGCRRGAS